MGAGNLGDLSNLDSATLLQYLPGVRFPAEKEQIATHTPSLMKNTSFPFLQNKTGHHHV